MLLVALALVTVLAVRPTHATLPPIPSLTFDDFSDTTDLLLFASTPSTSDGVVLRLMDLVSLYGRAFGRSRIDVSAFSTTFDFRITNSGGASDGIEPGGDGFTFQILPAATLDGIRLGYERLPSSVAVEFDTFKDAEDFDSNHVGIDVDGVLDSVVSVPVMPRWDDGGVWHVWIDYDGTTLEVRASHDADRPQAALLAYPIDLASTIGSRTAILAFGAFGRIELDPPPVDTIDILRWQSFGTLASITDAVIATADFRKDLFGGAFAYAGGKLFVGAPFHSTSVSGASRRVGRVYVYDDAGVLTGTIENPDAESSANFGGDAKYFGGAMASDESTVLVSAPYNFGEGAVYVMNAATGTVSMTVRHPVPARAPNSQFGRTVALLPSTIAVGAYDGGVGAVFLFDRATGSPLKELVCPDCDDPTISFNFGDSLVVRQGRLVTSERNGGNVYEFDGVTGDLVATRQRPLAYNWGLALGVVGDDLLIASYRGIFRLDPDGNVVQEYHGPNDETPAGSIYDAVVGTDDLVIAAEATESSLGRFPSSAHVFDAATGVLIAELPDPRPDPSPIRHFTGFGAPMLFANDRVYLGSGSHGAGTYDFGANTFIEGGDSLVFRFDPARFAIDAGYAPPRAQPRFGVAVAVDGPDLVVPTPSVVDDIYHCVGRLDTYDLAGPFIDRPAAYDTCVPVDAVAVAEGVIVAGAHTWDAFKGMAFLYEIPTTVPRNFFSVPLSRTALVPPMSSPGDEFGTAVGINDQRVFIGAPGDDTAAPDGGVVRVFDAGSAHGLLGTLTAPAPSQGSRFGAALAAANGRVVVGAPFDAAPTGVGNDVAGAGRAYQFDAATTTHLQSFDEPAPVAGDLFGGAVAFDGTWVLVGSPLRDVAIDGVVQPDVGTAYLFDAASGALVHELRNPSPTANDQFGFAVALVSGHPVVAAPLEDSGGLVDAGAVYVFDPVTGAVEETLTDPRPSPGPRVQFGFALGASGDRLAIGAPEANFVQVLTPCVISGCTPPSIGLAFDRAALAASTAETGTLVDPLVLACLGGYCDDGDPCTLERCDEGGCRYDQRIIGCGTDNPCDDAIVCNGQEGAVECSGQLCHLHELECCTTTHYECTTTRAAIDGTSCDDGNPCDGIAVCHAGECVPGAPARDGDSCDDGDVCNGLAICKAGSCQPGIPPSCAADEHCACDPTYGCDCRPACDDAHPCPDLPCRTNERCVDGECRSDPVMCPGVENPCVDSICQDDIGCVERTKVDGTPCDDCSADHSNPAYGQCESGTCRPHSPIAGFRCVASNVLGAEVCGDELVPDTLYRYVSKRIGTLETLIDAAEKTKKPHRAAALVARAKVSFAKTHRHVSQLLRRELRKQHLSTSCGMRIDEAVSAVGNALNAIGA